jgi:predicted nuclease of restriction endonuclease-like (RecB) superfamily
LSSTGNTACSPSRTALSFPKLAERGGTCLDWQDGSYYLQLFSSLSWSHFRELMKVDADLERAFYEVETLQHQWSVRELKRQRSTRLYQRVGLSKDKAAVLRFATTGQHGDTAATIVRDPYVLEFLGLPELPAYNESELEQRLMDHLQRFLIELGTDFGLIGRQRRITLDGQHFYIDLLFYHTRLKAYVVLELKATEFRPEYIGQLNFYLNYVREKISAPDDNPPIGILLCTDKSDAVAQYATAGIDQQLFVSRYLEALPSPDELARVVRQERESLEAHMPDRERTEEHP